MLIKFWYSTKNSSIIALFINKKSAELSIMLMADVPSVLTQIHSVNNKTVVRCFTRFLNNGNTLLWIPTSGILKDDIPVSSATAQEANQNDDESRE